MTDGRPPLPSRHAITAYFVFTFVLPVDRWSVEVIEMALPPALAQACTAWTALSFGNDELSSVTRSRASCSIRASSSRACWRHVFPYAGLSETQQLNIFLFPVLAHLCGNDSSVSRLTLQIRHVVCSSIQVDNPICSTFCVSYPRAQATSTRADNPRAAHHSRLLGNDDQWYSR